MSKKLKRCVAEELAKNELAHEMGERVDEVEILGLIAELGFEDLERISEEFGIGSEQAVLHVETVKGTTVGLEVQTAFGARSGKNGGDFRVGVDRAKVEDVLLICGREFIEFGYVFHNSGDILKEGVGNPWTYPLASGKYFSASEGLIHFQAL